MTQNLGTPKSNLPRPQQPSHRTRIVTLVLGTGLPVLVLAIFGLWQYLDASKQQVVDDRTAAADAAALTAQGFISDVISSAQTLALSPEVTDPSRQAGLPSLLERVQQANPEWDQLAVLDESGRDVASRGPVGVDSPEVRALLSRVVEDGLPRTSSTSTSPTTSARLLIGVPVNFEDGARGMLLVSPSLRSLTAAVQSLARGARLQTGIVDSNGVQFVGPPLAHSLPPQELHDATVTKNPGAWLGSGELIAYAPVQDFGWTVVIAQPTADAFAALERQVSFAILAMILGLGLAGLMAWILGGKLTLYYRRTLEARDLAEHAVHMRDAVLASVSHDLRNPLAAAKGYLQLLHRRVESDPGEPACTLAVGIEQTQRAVNRMQIMADELVDAARVRSGYDLQLRPGLTDLRALTMQVVDEQRVAAHDHPIRVDCASSEVWLICDPGRMSRVIANLLSNSVKYSPPDSGIVVELQRETDAAGEWVVWSIADKGIGIPAEDLPHIFELFHRGRNVSGQTMGTGLGLPGVRTIVQQHGGQVEVHSEEGAGTTVRIRLPRGSIKARSLEIDGAPAEMSLPLPS